MYGEDDLVVCLGDFNGHVVKYVDGGYGVGQRNFLVLFGDGIMCVKCMVSERGKGEVTFRMGENETH